ncbi:MAG: MotA/TolQ/ExbB proton channel family protein [Gammaproteobacteria bacterium]|nr:MotA/TolQ/ExbB proton channel family protein [Gammaproteobacteria bacterium]
MGSTDFLLAGGPVLWVLLAVSVVALAIVMLKVWQFGRERPETCPDVDTALHRWRDADWDEARESLDSEHPVSVVVALSMDELMNGIDDDMVRQEADRLATVHLNRLRAHLPALDGIGVLSPLLGLLGTVVGMIVAFQQMEIAGAQVDPSTLSSGIWQALLTTAVGLGIAIPTIAVHNWMERKVERVAMRMNDAVTQVFLEFDRHRKDD